MKLKKVIRCPKCGGTMILTSAKLSKVLLSSYSRVMIISFTYTCKKCYFSVNLEEEKKF
ncbi:MAG: hypothetical protein ACPLZG_11370 [Thermoproteota archaeon]